MPIYEYLCQACGTLSEINHRMSDPPARDCPVCGKPELSKQVSAPAFRLKGAGWYETDFKKDGKRNLAGEGEAKPEAADAKPDAKPDLKPDAKPDAKPSAAPETGKGDAKPAKSDAPSNPKSPAKSDTKPAPPTTPSSPSP